MQHSDQQSQESVLERTQIVPQIDGDDDERRQNERSRVFQPRGGSVEGMRATAGDASQVGGPLPYTEIRREGASTRGVV